LNKFAAPEEKSMMVIFKKPAVPSPGRCLFTLVFLLCASRALPQFYNLPGEYSFSMLTEKTLAKPDSAIHTGIKPYIHFFSPRYVNVQDTSRVFRFIVDDPAIETIFHKHLIRVEPKSNDFKLRLDPLLNMQSGKDIADSSGRTFYTNSRGFIGSGQIGSKFYFETLFSENQSVFPAYLSAYAKGSAVVPGQGRWKNFKSNGYDYAFSSGFFSVQLLKNLNLQAGHGKQKIGHGYRSLLLSDNAFNYPYCRITQQWFRGRVQYTNIYASLMNLVPAAAKINPNAERLFQKKAASFQYLSINITKWLNVGFFQGLIWKAADDKNRQHLDWQFFNPLIFANMFTYGVHNQNNIVGGMDLNVKLSRRLSIYCQGMLDNSKWFGYLAGIKYFDAFGIKNLALQVENIQVRIDSYRSPWDAKTDQSYTHYGQNLAYTLNDGQETILICDYRKKRFYFNGRYHSQITVSRPVGSFYHTNIVNAVVGYIINPSYNLNIALGVLYRDQNFYTFKPALPNETNYIYMALRTSLYNLYYDF